MCVCVCVFLGSVCLKLLWRDVFERFIWCLDHWLSCMLDCIHVCVFHFSKTAFKSQLNTSSIPCCLSSFLSFFHFAILTTSRYLVCVLDSFSTAGGQIGLLFLHLMGCSSTPPRYLYLSKTISSIPSSTAVSIPLDTFIC